MFRSIGHKIIAVVGLSVAFGLAASMAFYVRHQEEAVLAQNERTMRKLTESVIQGLRSVMLAGHADIAQAFADRLHFVPEVEDFRILRVDGSEAFRDNQTIADVNRRRGHETFMPHQSESHRQVVARDHPQLARVAGGAELASYYETDAKGGRLLTILAAIRNADPCHRCHGGEQPVRGVLKLTTSLALAQRDIERARRNSLLLMGAALAGILALTAYMLRRGVVQPIRGVTEAMARTAGGDFTQRVPAEGRDELAQMAQSFNLMVGELDRSYASLRESEEKFRSLVESSSDLIWETDAGDAYTYVSPKVRELLGYAPEELLGRTPFDFMPVEAARAAREQFGAGAPRAFLMLENTRIHRDGRQVVLETSGTPVLDESGAYRGCRGVDRDITGRKAAQEQLRKLSRAVEQSANAVMVTDRAGVIEYVNPKFCEITGYTREEVVGCTPNLLKSEDTHPETFRRMWETLLSGREWVGELHNRKKNGDYYWCTQAISPLRNEQGEVTHFVAITEDISDRKRAEQAIRNLAFYDPLTGLPNRRLFRDRLVQAVAGAKRGGVLFALLYLDLDRFKTINDTLGHDVGDLMLKAVGERMTACLREGDTIARLGGDEFAVILPDLEQPEDAAHIAEKLNEHLKHPFLLHGHELFMTTSTGISVYPADAEGIETLIKNADIALYRAKELGRNNFQFFTADMNRQITQRLMLENSMRRAVERQEFVLQYQLQVDLESGRINGVEALLRWRHPELGLVPPRQFIAIAEDTGLIVPIGEWVLRSACRQAREWRALGIPAMRIAVNLSARQFRQSNLVQMVAEVLRETGLPADALELELTESILMEETEQVIATLQALHALGIQISIDDFGTGYSSLSYLKRMPIHVLKIDQSFVRDIASDPDDRAIVTAIIALAHSLKLKVIAEGVEREDQLRFLKSQQCDHLQGYLFSDAVDAEEFTAMLKACLHGLPARASL